MERELKLNVITPFGSEYDSFVKEVILTENDGLISFLKEYAPTMGKVKRGLLKVVNLDNSVNEYIVDDGVFSISNNLLKIITNFFIVDSKEEKEKVTTLRKESLDCLNSKNRS
ncbi:MAG: hypothetical protein K2I67_03075, partial [Malacoplasma sp.]|nr:hypothetical protein [Malacoplasma sp.]